MTLIDHLKLRIANKGYLNVAQFMEACLTHPTYGYYITRDPIGSAGDFTTAPEISQMFGELIGCWAAAVWKELGSPKPLSWIELGPGHGTLTADAIRAIEQVSAMTKEINVHLVETSPILRQRQKEILTKWHPTWHADMETIPGGPSIIIANEFFDALPIRQFMRKKQTWRERIVTLDKHGALAFTWSSPISSIPKQLASPAEVPNGEIVEICPSAIKLAKTLTHHLCSHGGVGLIIDYGYDAHIVGDTLQAVINHTYTSILEAPGEADLSAHVDFKTIAGAVKSAGGITYGPVTQGNFFRSLGIEARVKQLSENATPQQLINIKRAFERLTKTDAMGLLFKVMGVGVPGQLHLPGFSN